MKSTPLPESQNTWADCLSRVFPDGFPTRHEWEDVQGITGVLTAVFSSGACTVLLPGGGDIDVAGVAIRGDGAVELTSSLEQIADTYVINPAHLNFRAHESTPWMACFLLQLAPTSTTPRFPDPNDYSVETFVEGLDGTQYPMNMGHITQERTHAPATRLQRVTRFWRGGTILILPKACPFPLPMIAAHLGIEDELLGITPQLKRLPGG